MFTPDDYDPEADFIATGSVLCNDCGSRVRPRTLESLPSHRCTERRAQRLAETAKQVMVMYRLADRRGMPLGVFDTPEEAMCLVPEVNGDWRPVKDGRPGDYDGWRPDGSYFREKPDFTIRVAGEED